jgi:hypothetical protein
VGFAKAKQLLPAEHGVNFSFNCEEIKREIIVIILGRDNFCPFEIAQIPNYR